MTAVHSSSFIALFKFVSRLSSVRKKYGSKLYLPLELALPLNRFSLLLWLNTPGMRWFAHQRFNRLHPRLRLLKVFTTRLLRNNHRTLRKWEFLDQTGCLLNLGSSSYFLIQHLSVSCENCSVFRVQLHRAPLRGEVLPPPSSTSYNLGVSCAVSYSWMGGGQCSAERCCPLPHSPTITGCEL